jgi:hypothetical protein
MSAGVLALGLLTYCIRDRLSSTKSLPPTTLSEPLRPVFLAHMALDPTLLTIRITLAAETNYLCVFITYTYSSAPVR